MIYLFLFSGLAAARGFPGWRGSSARHAEALSNLADDNRRQADSQAASGLAIACGRQALMPADKALLGEEKVHILAPWVHS